MVEKRASTDIPELEEVLVAQFVGGALESNDAEALPDASGLEPDTPDEGGREPEATNGEDITQKKISRTATRRDQQIEMQQTSSTQHACKTLYD